jgi:hypothetical protein
MALSVGSPISLKGPAGSPGVAGVPGSKIYFVTAAPTDTNASSVPGDVAFNTATNLLYQRTSTGWPTSGSLLQGGMGVTGVSGASFYSGPAAPTASAPANPNNGDLYLDLANGEIYKFVNGAWSDQGYSIIGPPGQVGSPGIRGSQIYSGSGSFVASNFTNPSPAAGDLYLDTSGPTLYVIQGS